MNKVNFTTILKGLTKKTLAPVYLLHGKESYFTSQLVERIVELAIPVSEKSFNEQICFGKDVSVGDVLSIARRYPMMAERQLIVIKNANEITDLGQKESYQLLLKYIAQPLASTILVLHFTDALDERKSWVKSALKTAFVYKSIPLYDNELPEFVTNYCQSKGAKINLKATHLLIEHTGNDLSKLSNEIDKVLLNLKIGENIEEHHIEKYVGISKDYNVFELQRVLGRRNFSQSYKIISYLAQNSKKNPIQPLIILLFTYFSKILLLKYSTTKSETELCKLLEVKPFFLSEYKMAANNYTVPQLFNVIHALKKADLASKGVDSSNNTEGQVLYELLIGIFA